MFPSRFPLTARLAANHWAIHPNLTAAQAASSPTERVRFGKSTHVPSSMPSEETTLASILASMPAANTALSPIRPATQPINFFHRTPATRALPSHLLNTPSHTHPPAEPISAPMPAPQIIMYPLDPFGVGAPFSQTPENPDAQRQPLRFQNPQRENPETILPPLHRSSPQNASDPINPFAINVPFVASTPASSQTPESPDTLHRRLRFQDMQIESLSQQIQFLQQTVMALTSEMEHLRDDEPEENEWGPDPDSPNFP